LNYNENDILVLKGIGGSLSGILRKPLACTVGLHNISSQVQSS